VKKKTAKQDQTNFVEWLLYLLTSLVKKSLPLFNRKSYVKGTVSQVLTTSLFYS